MATPSVVAGNRNSLIQKLDPQAQLCGDIAGALIWTTIVEQCPVNVACTQGKELLRPRGGLGRGGYFPLPCRTPIFSLQIFRHLWNLAQAFSVKTEKQRKTEWSHWSLPRRASQRNSAIAVVSGLEWGVKRWGWHLPDLHRLSESYTLP